MIAAAADDWWDYCPGIFHHKTTHRQGGKNHVLLFAESSQKKGTVCGNLLSYQPNV